MVVGGKVGVFEGLFAGDNAVVEAVVEAAIVLVVHVALGGEAADLAAKARAELGGVAMEVMTVLERKWKEFCNL